MNSQKLQHALAALAICTVGYLGPWWLGMFQPVQDVVHIDRESTREARLVHLPPQTVPDEIVEARVEDEVPAEVDDAPVGPESALVDASGESDTVLPELPIAVEVADVGTAIAIAPPKGREKRTVRRQVTRRGARACLPDRDDVAAVDDTAFRVEDGLVYYYANHIQEASKLAASWWNQDDAGERYGFKIGRMQCGSLLRQMGFKNGDVITSVNGHEIRSYTDGVTAFMRLRAKRILWVDVLRRGEEVRLDFVLVDDGEALAEYDEDHPLYDPSALVDRELELAELPWLQRRGEKRRDRREARQERRQRG